MSVLPSRTKGEVHPRRAESRRVSCSWSRKTDSRRGLEAQRAGETIGTAGIAAELAERRFRVENLHLDRASAGAKACMQRFGGFSMSGIGTKAGGPRDPLNFADPRTVTENLLAR